jgi:predicted restriction endonuclease
MRWKDAVIIALRRFSDRHQTRIINRQKLINEELDQIKYDTNSQGATPAQTLSRILQELREEGVLYFLEEGVYLLLDIPLKIEEEELSDSAIDFAIKQKKLQIGTVVTGDKVVLARQRKGQARIRTLTLQNYNFQCALCDLTDVQLLVSSHISRWSDDPEGRGDLSNVISSCKFHDALFESGYFSLANDFKILKKERTGSQIIDLLLTSTAWFRPPPIYFPAPQYLRKHRIRTGFE